MRLWFKFRSYKDGGGDLNMSQEIDRLSLHCTIEKEMTFWGLDHLAIKQEKSHDITLDSTLLVKSIPLNGIFMTVACT